MLTAPGDPLAGAALALADAGAVGPPPWAASVAALALYAGGLIDNDLTGLDEDRCARPERPLCRGEITLRTASTARMILFLVGVVSAAVAGRGPLAVAVFLVGLILLYHRRLARHAVAGPAALAMCRAASLGMGVAAVEGAVGAHVWTAMAIWTLFIAGVSALARRETDIPGRPRHIGQALGTLPLLQAAAVLVGRQPWSKPLAAALAAAGAAAMALQRRIPAS